MISVADLFADVGGKNVAWGGRSTAKGQIEAFWHVATGISLGRMGKIFSPQPCEDYSDAMALPMFSTAVMSLKTDVGSSRPAYLIHRTVAAPNGSTD